MGGSPILVETRDHTGRWQVNILLLSAGGGGGNILRSVKGLFQRDVEAAQETDPQYAARLTASVTTRFLDTNEFSLADIPAAERLLIGPKTTGRLGARHSPDVARAALEESRRDVEALIARHSVIVIIATGGKGTGAGTIFPLAQIARQYRKLVLPIFVRPSFERHEVDKRRHDHALQVAAQFDAAKIRLMEILNDRGYVDDNPQPQSVVWERMNLPIARSLRGLIYVLWDLSQVDPSDLSILFAGNGRFRIAFAELNPPAGQDPSQAEVQLAVQGCCENPYYAFGKPAGTSLICIHGEWSNVVDARIKGHLAAAAMGDRPDSPYTPLYVRAVHAPRPWGVTALLSEFTGSHQPLDIEWSIAADSEQRVLHLELKEPRIAVLPAPVLSTAAPVGAPDQPDFASEEIEPASASSEDDGRPAFSSFWEFAVAINRSDPVALALARSSASQALPMEPADVRKLLGTVWFRGVVPRLSESWKTRVLDVLVDGVAVPNHPVRRGKQNVRLSDMSYQDLLELAKMSTLATIRPDLDLLLAVGRLWGEEGLRRLRFGDAMPNGAPTMLAGLFQGMRLRGESTSAVDERR
jgi:cell division GTPase FtsZ